MSIIKNGLDYKFKNGEYVKISPLYNEHSWFTKTPYKIIKFCEKCPSDDNAEHFYKLDSGTLNFSLAIQDEECLKLNRKEKLKKIK